MLELVVVGLIVVAIGAYLYSKKKAKPGNTGPGTGGGAGPGTGPGVELPQVETEVVLEDKVVAPAKKATKTIRKPATKVVK